MPDKVTEALRGVRKRVAKRRTRKKAKQNKRQRKVERVKEKTQPARDEAAKLKSDISQATPNISVPGFGGGGGDDSMSVGEELADLDDQLGTANDAMGRTSRPGDVVDEFDNPAGNVADAFDGSDPDPVDSNTDELGEIFDD